MIRLRVAAFGAVLAASLVAHAQPASELRLNRVRESLTGTHRHYQQFIGGIEVVGGERAETLLSEGAIRVDFDRAAQLPLAAATAGVAGSAASADLVYVNVAGQARLARRVVVEERRLEPHARYLDVATGRVLRDEPLFYTAKGRVFDVNPVAKLNDPSLRDDNDSAAAVPDAAYSEVDLPGLEPSGPLTGSNVQIVDIEAPFTPRADASQSLDFDRSQPQFEEVNAYFQLDRAQRYLQSLGYTGARRLVAYSIPVDAHAANGTDNSYYIQGSPPGRGTLYFGDGGTEDAEDSDIILHEFGHAIHDWIIPGALTGASSSQARAVSEGFGDYWSFSSTYALTIVSGRDPFCIADWDARCAADDPSRNCAYPPGADCLRRVDSTKTIADYIASDDPGTEHKNGEIWSSALREIFMTLVRRYGADEGKRVTDTIALESLFGLPPGPDFRTVAQSMIAADRQLRNGSEVDLVCSAMTARGIFAAGDCGTSPRGEWTLFQSPDQQVAIPDGTGSITSGLTIGDTRTIAKLAVRVDIAHTSRGDLVISLIAPNGTTVKLKDSSQTDRTPDVHATFGLDAPAVDSLDVFSGQPANGTWKLVVSDVYAGDVGALQGWSLLIDFAGDAPLARRPTTTAARLIIPVVAHTIGAAGTQYRSDVYLLNRGSRDTTATLILTPSGADGTTTFAAMKVTIAAGQTMLFSDVVATVFASSGIGSLEIQGDTANLLAWSDVVNATPIGPVAQSIEAASSIDAAGSADPPRYTIVPSFPPAPNLIIPLIRMNVGAVETAGLSGTIHVATRTPDGKSYGSADFAIAPFGHAQLPIAIEPGGVAVNAVEFTVTGGARIVSYGSMVLTLSGDAIYRPAAPLPTQEIILTLPVSGQATGVAGAPWSTSVDYVNVIGGDSRDTGSKTTRTFYRAAEGTPLLPPGMMINGESATGPNVIGQTDIDVAPGGVVFADCLTFEAGVNDDAPVGDRIGAYPKSSAIAAGSSADALHIESTAELRTNFGISEADGVPGDVRVTLFEASGRSLGSTEMTLGPRQMQQIPISALYGGALTNGRLQFEVISGGHVFGYVSVVNNTNNDSVFELAR
jgi:subtilisin-like proprotein convertase family protein